MKASWLKKIISHKWAKQQNDNEINIPVYILSWNEVQVNVISGLIISLSFFDPKCS